MELLVFKISCSQVWKQMNKRAGSEHRVSACQSGTGEGIKNVKAIMPSSLIRRHSGCQIPQFDSVQHRNMRTVYFVSISAVLFFLCYHLMVNKVVSLYKVKKDQIGVSRVGRPTAIKGCHRRRPCLQHLVRCSVNSRHIGSESRFLPTTPAFDAPVRGVPVGILLSCLVWKN